MRFLALCTTLSGCGLAALPAPPEAGAVGPARQVAAVAHDERVLAINVASERNVSAVVWTVAGVGTEVTQASVSVDGGRHFSPPWVVTQGAVTAVTIRANAGHRGFFESLVGGQTWAMNLRTADNQWWRTDDGKTFLPTSDDTFMDWTAWVGDEPATTLLLPPAAESELSAVLARAPHAGSELSSMQMDTPLSVVVTWTRGTTLALTRYPATQVEPHESAGFHIPVVVATDHISGTPSAAAGSTGGALAAYVQTTPSGRSIAVRTVSYDRECTVAARESAVPASGTPGPPIIR